MMEPSSPASKKPPKPDFPTFMSPRPLLQQLRLQRELGGGQPARPWWDLGDSRLSQLLPP